LANALRNKGIVAGRSHEAVHRHPCVAKEADTPMPHVSPGALHALANFAAPTVLAIAIVRLHADAQFRVGSFARSQNLDFTM